MTEPIESDTVDMAQFKMSPVETSDQSFDLSEEKTQYIHINQFSQWEASRQLAALCRLFLRVLARDFNIHSPESISIRPSEHGGVRLRIDCPD
ncbi:MAG: hypothetical protein ACFFDU_08235 [Candidatus Thorarchaeota archaeon]